MIGLFVKYPVLLNDRYRKDTKVTKIIKYRFYAGCGNVKNEQFLKNCIPLTFYIDGRYGHTILHGHNVVPYMITDITDKDYATYYDSLEF